MDIQLDASVVSREGADLGKIDKVIFDPQTSGTKDIVVRKGLILTRDVAIPVEHIRVATPTRVELDLSKDEVEALRDFVESDYSWPPSNWVAPYGWPVGGVMWPTAYVGAEPIGFMPPVPPRVPDEVLEAERQMARENAVVGQGADVLALGGEKVGSVQNMLIDPQSHKPARVVIKRGLLVTEDVELPGEWVESLDNERITLNVDKVTVEHLAKRRR